MKYVQLSQDYQDDALADALYARELEWFHYDFDRANFVEMLRMLPASEFRDMIAKRLEETIVQMQRVEIIHASLELRITDIAAHEAAILRVTAKRNAVKV